MASLFSQKLQNLGDVQQLQMESRSWGGGQICKTDASLFSHSDGESVPL